MDQDFHSIRDAAGATINPPTEIHFGDRVWIGCRATVLKGAAVGDGTVVAAGSTVVGAFPGKDQVIAGCPARVVKAGVKWGTEASF
jgi:acetyltransferase-like isoleucine patch superfamily enzyme